MSIAHATRTMLRRYGRDMTLRRRLGTGTTFSSASTLGVLSSYGPDQLVGGIVQGDARIILDAVPIVAANLFPVQKGDQVVADGRTWAVQAPPRLRFDGPILCAIEVWVRGG